jgi:hypothetical protein
MEKFLPAIEPPARRAPRSLTTLADEGEEQGDFAARRIGSAPGKSLIARTSRQSILGRPQWK